MDSHAIDIDQTLESLKAMARQDKTSYVVNDYLSQISAEHVLEISVDASCRQTMAKWCVDIADFCKYSRETAFTAISCLDRFMCNDPSVLLDRDQFQLAAMVCLYSAVKVHEHEAMDPSLVSSLSRGAHSPESVESMERRMLSAIQWRINPPSAMAYVRNLLDLIPPQLIDKSGQDTIIELAQLQVDLTLTDHLFFCCPALSIGMSAFLNAFETVASEEVHNYAQQKIVDLISCDQSAIRDIRVYLYESISDIESMDMDIDTQEKEKFESYGSSQAVHA